MLRFDVLAAVAAPYPQANVDTDRIIRVERCARVAREDMGLWAFEADRFLAGGGENPAFVFHRAPFRGAGILVAGPNFGCGSSREMAVWAIAGMGIRCVIAPSFGEIFRNNCFQNGVLAVQLPADVVERLLARLSAAPGDAPAQATLTVDLTRNEIRTPWGEALSFDVEPLQREGLLQGLDPIGLTLQRAGEIDAYQARMRGARPWVFGV
jgi:3-isopropylmalate/(R)-2-methylmalate dehydratase small subunit